MKLGLGQNLINIASLNGLFNKINPFQDATAAYSLRDLGLGATNVVRVRRSTDNAEQDFTASEITDGTLTSFCGVSDGFVSVWYNQKSSMNVRQETASAQPKIVSSGSLILDKGKPILKLNGISQYLTAGLGNSLNYSDNLSIFRVINSNELGTNRRIMSDDKIGVQGYFIDYFSSAIESLRLNDGDAYKISLFSFLSINKKALYSTIFNGLNGDVYYKFNTLTEIDNIPNFSTPISSSGEAGFTIGSGADGGQYFDGLIQEIIIYDKNKLTERQDIETNINNYYAIY